MTLAERIYEQFPEYLQNNDLETFVTALGDMFQEMTDLSADGPNGEIGWSILVDLSRAPSEALPWLAQFVGATTIPSLSDADQRTYIQSKPGWKRGSLDGMTAEIQAVLTGTKRVIITERDSSAYHFAVLTFTAETPSTTRVNQAIVAQKPAGLQYTYTTSTGQDYAYASVAYATYNTLNTSYLTYGGVETLEVGT